jgi:hypothetical protein
MQASGVERHHAAEEGANLQGQLDSQVQAEADGEVPRAKVPAIEPAAQSARALRGRAEVEGQEQQRRGDLE